MKIKSGPPLTQSQIKTFLFVSLFLWIAPIFTYAQEGGGGGTFGKGWKQRSQAREGSRWTLQDWLAQKQRNSLMDQWLMMNSPSPFEFSLKGASNSYQFQKDSDGKKSYLTSKAALSAYAQAVGLTGEYENNLKEKLTDVTGLLNLRILGASLQTTSITLHVGQRTRQYLENSQQESIRNFVTQISVQAYFTKYFGLFGSYRNFSPASHPTLGNVSGNHIEGGLFIDFQGLRVFGNWSDELQVNQAAANGVKTKYKRQGIESGIVIFF